MPVEGFGYGEGQWAPGKYAVQAGKGIAGLLGKLFGWGKKDKQGQTVSSIGKGRRIHPGMVALQERLRSIDASKKKDSNQTDGNGRSIKHQNLGTTLEDVKHQSLGTTLGDIKHQSLGTTLGDIVHQGGASFDQFDPSNIIHQGGAAFDQFDPSNIIQQGGASFDQFDPSNIMQQGGEAFDQFTPGDITQQGIGSEWDAGNIERGGGLLGLLPEFQEEEGYSLAEDLEPSSAFGKYRQPVYSNAFSQNKAQSMWGNQ